MASSFGSACDEYDPAIRTATDRWWGDLRIWKLWRAQLYAESACNPAAASAVGATGLAQIMPATAADLARQLGYDKATSPHNAKFAIEAGAAYMARLRSVWRRDRLPIETHWLGAASYNAGTGSILKAQALCHDSRLWREIAPCLVMITGDKNAAETLHYVTRIGNYWLIFERAG